MAGTRSWSLTSSHSEVKNALIFISTTPIQLYLGSTNSCGIRQSLLFQWWWGLAQAATGLTCISTLHPAAAEIQVSYSEFWQCKHSATRAVEWARTIHLRKRRNHITHSSLYFSPRGTYSFNWMYLSLLLITLVGAIQNFIQKKKRRRNKSDYSTFSIRYIHSAVKFQLQQ